MNSIPPSAAGVPSGNNTKYIVIALLLLGAIGGLAYCKFGKADPPPVITTIAPVNTLPATTKPVIRDDDIPPPDTAAVATVTAPLKGTGTVPAGNGGNGGCGGDCNGSAGDDLRAALNQRARQARKCYDRELANDPKLVVDLAIKISISNGGGVCNANLVNTNNASVGACVLNQFRAGNYPAARGGCAAVTVPLHFIPKS